MDDMIRFFHVLGAIAAGFYLLFPFLILRINKLSAPAQEGYMNGLFVANRIGQYIFIAQLITGAHLIWGRPSNYSTVWIIVVLVGFVILAALAGIMGKPMKRMISNLKNGGDTKGYVKRITTFSIIIAILFFLLIGMMSFPF